MVRKMGEDQIYTVKEPVRVTKCDLIEYQLKQMGRVSKPILFTCNNLHIY